MHAQVVATTGLAAGAHGSAEHQDGAAELAENRALARAMTALGIQVPHEIGAPRLHTVGGLEQSGRVLPFPTQESPNPGVNQTPPEADPAPEDISWTAFWKWAKTNGIENKAALEARIGQSIDRMSPAEARRLAMAVVDPS
jgi:hypothetical protein